MVMTEQEKSEIVALFDQWNAALATGDPDKVASLYGPGAVLLPTVSNKVRTDYEGYRSYFEHFLTMQPQGVIEQGFVRRYGDIAIHSGVYLFTMGATGGKVRARFTFVYRRHDGDWLIEEHHSSAMPEKE